MLELAAGDGPYDEKGFRPPSDGGGQWGIWQLIGQILLASEESQECSALLCDMVADRPAQHRIGGLKRVEDRALRCLTFDIQLYFTSDFCQRPQMWRENDSYHGSVWTSTESTAGRSRTKAFQLSPSSTDAYTCPPVVPKYTPHESSESTAIASRKTLT